MIDRKDCIKAGTHNGAGGTSTDIVQIGNELVTYEDTLCSVCNTPSDRKIVNRQKL